MSTFFSKTKQMPWLLAIILIVFTTALSILAYSYYSSQVKQIRKNFDHQLSALADLKAAQIVFWRTERLVDGERIKSDPRISRSIEMLFNSPNDPVIIAENLEWMKSLLGNPDYSSAFLIDRNGKTIFQVGETNSKLGTAGKLIAMDSLISHEMQMTDLLSDEDGTILMDLVIPIVSQGNELNSAIAIIILQINPEVTLFPLVQAWPTTSQTAETLLVRKEGDDVIYLNELRYQSNTALKLRFPITNTTLPASMAVNGVTGIVEGIDYRGIPVIAALVPVDGTDWKMVAKVDRLEIYSPLRSLGWSTAGILVFLLLTAGFSLFMLWRRQSAKYYKNLYEAEYERKNLEAKYSTLFNQANDSILLISDDEKIFDANEQAIIMYGYDRKELLALTVNDLRDSSARSQTSSDMRQVRQGNSNVFETLHRRKNGEVFQVSVSSRYLSLEGKGVYQSIIRDVTHQKKAENQLRFSELALKKAQQVSHVGSWTWNIEANILEWSDEMFHIFGIEKEGFKGDLAEVIANAIHPDDRAKVNLSNQAVIEQKKPTPLEYRVVWPDGSIHVVWAEAGELILDESGKPKNLSGIVQDITGKKTIENELRRRENLLSKVIEILPIGLEIADKTGMIIQTNKAIEQIWGKVLHVSPDEYDVFHARKLPSRELIKPEEWASIRTINEGLTIKDELIEIDAYDGKTKTILNYSTPILDENGSLEGAIVLNLDITDLKKAELQLSAQLEELQRWNLATLGRESRILELKKEINELLKKQGLPIKYQSADEDAHV